MKIKETSSTIKIHFPKEIKDGFIDYCRMSSLIYGRTIWTLARMFIEGKVDRVEFGREYYKSSQSVLKNQTVNLLTGRINGDKAHATHKKNEEIVAEIKDLTEEVDRV